MRPRAITRGDLSGSWRDGHGAGRDLAATGSLTLSQRPAGSWACRRASNTPAAIMNAPPTTGDAALAVMPPGAAVKSLDSVVGARRVLSGSCAGRHEAVARSAPRAIGEQGAAIARVPAFSFNHVPVGSKWSAAETTPQHQWLNQPSENPLRCLVAREPTLSRYRRRGKRAGKAPVYVPQNAREGTSIAQPVLIEQAGCRMRRRSRQRARFKEEADACCIGGQIHFEIRGYSGTVNLSPFDQTSIRPSRLLRPLQDWNFRTANFIGADGRAGRPRCRRGFAEETDSQ